MEQTETKLPDTVEKDGSDIEVKTEAYDISIGFDKDSLETAESLAAPIPLPQWNGLRIKSPGDPRIYLVDRGFKRHIPNPITFNNLFRNWSYNEVIDIGAISTGEPITSGAILAKAVGTAPVYFISNNQKRHIISPSVMDKYNFNWNRIYSLPASVINSIPRGGDIS